MQYAARIQRGPADTLRLQPRRFLKEWNQSSTKLLTLLRQYNKKYGDHELPLDISPIAPHKWSAHTKRFPRCNLEKLGSLNDILSGDRRVCSEFLLRERPFYDLRQKCRGPMKSVLPWTIGHGPSCLPQSARTIINNQGHTLRRAAYAAHERVVYGAALKKAIFL